MARPRYNDLTPRIEMTPIIDVIFLLLVFFIYSIVTMVRAEVLPVTLARVPAGEQASSGLLHAVTIDRDGHFFFNRTQVTLAELDRHLAAMAADPQQPTLYLAVEAQGGVDRGPLLIDLIGRVRAAGIDNFTIVGPPSDSSSPPISSAPQTVNAPQAPAARP